MRISGKPLDNISAEDVIALVENGVAESTELEYKQSLPGDVRTDLVKDVSAMANTSGGVILFGVSERREGRSHTGMPEGIKGIGEGVNEDTRRRLDQIIRDLTDPPLTSCRSRIVPMPTGESVLLLGVPDSYAGPHAIKDGQVRTYWRRCATGVYPVSSGELRRMFLRQSEWQGEIGRFRSLRLQRARAGVAVMTPKDSPGILISVLPVGRLDEILDIVSFSGQLIALDRIPYVGFLHRPNLDGYLLFSEESGSVTDFIQWLRCGGMEYFSTSHFDRPRIDGDRIALFDAATFAKQAVEVVRMGLSFMTGNLGLDPPFVVLLSVWGLEGCAIDPRGYTHLRLGRGATFSENEIHLPPALLSSGKSDVKEELLGAFDILWQAAGYSTSFMRHSDDFRQL